MVARPQGLSKGEGDGIGDDTGLGGGTDLQASVLWSSHRPRLCQPLLDRLSCGITGDRSLVSHRQLTQGEGGGRCCSEYPTAGSLWFSSGEPPCPLPGHVAPGGCRSVLWRVVLRSGWLVPWFPLSSCHWFRAGHGPEQPQEIVSQDLASPPLGLLPREDTNQEPEQLFCHSEADSERAANLEESRAEGCRESEAKDHLPEVFAGPQCSSPPLGRGLSVCSSTRRGIFRGTQWRAHSTMESLRV